MSEYESSCYAHKQHLTLSLKLIFYSVKEHTYFMSTLELGIFMWQIGSSTHDPLT